MKTYSWPGAAGQKTSTEKNRTNELKNKKERHRFEDPLGQVVQRGPFDVEAASNEIQRIQKLLVDLIRTIGDRIFFFLGATNSVKTRSRNFFFCLLLAQSAHFSLLYLRTCVLPHTPIDSVARIFPFTPMPRPRIELTSAPFGCTYSGFIHQWSN